MIVRISFVFCILARLSFAAAGDWPEPRQNSHLTAVQPIPGALKQEPARAGAIDLGRSTPNQSAAKLKDGTQVALSIFAGALRCFDLAGTPRWESHPAGLNYDAIVATEDLDGDGQAEVLLQAGRPAQPFGAAALVSLEDGQLLWRYDVEPMSYAWYLYADNYWPNDAKKQIVVVMHAYPPDKDNGYITLFSFEGSRAPAQKWRYPFDEYTCFPSLLRADIDGDGVKEIVVETHSRFWFIDALSGAVKFHLHWDTKPANERSYGLVKFTDLNKDGLEDFLCIANFAQHHEVLLNKKGSMEKAWGYGWDESVTVGKVATTYPDDPDVDVDGDGKTEIVISMFNSEKEDAWLMRVYDAVTGEIKYRVPGAVAVGTADLNGDGAYEVLANASSDPTRAKLDGARLLNFKSGKPEVIWSDSGCTAIPPSKKGDLSVEKGGERLAIKLDPSNAVSLEAGEKPQIEGKPDYSKIPPFAGPLMPKLLAADITGDGQNDLLLYQEPSARVYTWTGAAFALQREFTSSSLPVLADLDGDGKVDVVTTDVKPDHTPIVEAKSSAKVERLLWHSALPAPTREGLPAPRIAYVRTAHFTGAATPDLYLYAGTPIARSVALNGRTGELLWEKGETPGIERYWAPTVNLASAYDFDGDAKEDLVFTNPDYYCVAAASTGDALLGPLFPPKIFDQPSQGLYTLPAILERDGKVPSVALVAGHYFQAAMTLKAQPNWYAIPTPGQARCAEEGFLKLADGTWALGFGRQNGNFACLNVENGKTRWELPVEASCSDVTACDIDGDGQQEYVFGTSHGGLYAVGDAGDKPRVLWKAQLSGAAGAPILADLTGDGKTDIAVPTTDGYVALYPSPQAP